MSVSEFVTNTIACALSSADVQWMLMFVKWQGLRHPRGIWELEIEGFLAIMTDNGLGAFGWAVAQGRSGTVTVLPKAALE